MTIITTIFSALGNNSSLTPIIVKDSCDVTGRTVMAYKQGSKAGPNYAMHDAREMFLEETLTSCIWLGGIPALKVLFDKFVTNKVYQFDKNKEALAKYGKNALAKLDLRLLNENSPQSLQKAQIADGALKTEVEKIVGNKQLISKFKKLFISKAAVSTLVPLALIGFILPKLNYALTGEIVKREKAKSKKLAFKNLQEKQGEIAQNNGQFAAFMGHTKKKVSFGSMGEKVASFFMNPVYNMAVLDAGITTGRVTCARNKYEAIEKGIKEAGIIFFMYIGGKHIAKGLEYLSNKVFKTPITLDSKILEDKKFIVSVKKAVENKTTAALTAFTQNDEASIIQLIDKELAKNNGVFKNKTLAAAQKIGLIEVVDGKRNPLHFVDTEKVAELNKKIGEFVETALKNQDGVKQFVKKAMNIKRGMIVANLAICSTALAFVLPKVQYLFREKATKTAAAPGLGQYYK